MVIYIPLIALAGGFIAGLLAERVLSSKSSDTGPVFYSLQPVNWTLWIGISIIIVVFTLTIVYLRRR